MSELLFLQCLPFTLKEEVNWKDPFIWSDVRHNFSNDRGDPGGKTMCGIIQKEYNHYRKMNGLSPRDVRLISEDEGHWIYYNWYWLPYCDCLPRGLDLSFFDTDVNMGSHEAVLILQRSVRVAVDGQWGPKTAAAVANSSPAVAVKAFAAERLKVYREMQLFHRFGDDWTARTNRIEKASLERSVSHA